MENKNIRSTVLVLVVIVVGVIWYASAGNGNEAENLGVTNMESSVGSDAGGDPNLDESDSTTESNQAGVNAGQTINVRLLQSQSPLGYSIDLENLPKEFVPIFPVIDGYILTSGPRRLTNSKTNEIIGIQYGWSGEGVRDTGSTSGKLICPTGAGVRVVNCEVLTNKNGLQYVKETSINQLSENPESDQTVTAYFKVNTANRLKMIELEQPEQDYFDYFKFYSKVQNIGDLQIVIDSVNLDK